MLACWCWSTSTLTTGAALPARRPVASDRPLRHPELLPSHFLGPDTDRITTGEKKKRSKPSSGHLALQNPVSSRPSLTSVASRNRLQLPMSAYAEHRRGVESAFPDLSIIASSPRNVRFAPNDSLSNLSSNLSSKDHSLTSASTLESKLELSDSASAARQGVLDDTFFPAWQDDAGDLDSPEEMQKKDPLGASIWKLYSRTRSQLPNQERMENLSWRMMSMNLRKQQRAHKKEYVVFSPSPCRVGTRQRIVY